MALVQISSYTINPSQQLSSDDLLEIRGFYTRSFIGSDGVTSVAGNDSNGQFGPYYSITPTLNGSGFLIVPAHDIQPTTESNPTGNYIEQLWVNEAYSQTLMPNNNVGTGWQIPTTYGPVIAFDEIATYNRARRLVYPSDTYFTADETIAEIRRLAGDFMYAAVGVNGIGSTSVPPTVASLPILVEDNDPRNTNARTPTGAASGDLAGTYPSPTVTQARGLRTTTGPTTLAMGAVADGQFLRRSGASILGSSAIFDTWFNVANYGTDQTAINQAIAAFNTAGGGVLYFPKGNYTSTGALTAITGRGIIRGDGMAEATPAADGAVSKIACSSATAVLFTVNSTYLKFENLALLNTSGTTPSAGAGIVVTHPTALYNKVDYDSVYVVGFYDEIDIQAGALWTMRNCIIGGPVRYGLRIRNINNPDVGDWWIGGGTVFASSAHLATSAIRIESSGGGKIDDIKVNGVDGGGVNPSFNKGIDAVVTPGSTGILLIVNSSIENFRGNGIDVDGLSQVTVGNCQFGPYGNSTGRLIRLANLNDATVDNIVGNNSVTAGIAVEFENCTRTSFGNYNIKKYTYPVNFVGTYIPVGADGLSRFTTFAAASLFNNGWADFGGGYQVAGLAYINGEVIIRGEISAGTVNSTVATVPVGYRPTSTHVFQAVANGAFCVITINTDGTIVQSGAASNASLSLDGIRYYP